MPTFLPNLRLTRPLSLRICFCFHPTEKLGYSVDHDSIVREFHHAFLHENALNPMVFPSLRYPPHSAILGQFRDPIKRRGWDESVEACRMIPTIEYVMKKILVRLISLSKSKLQKQHKVFYFIYYILFNVPLIVFQSFCLHSAYHKFSNNGYTCTQLNVCRVLIGGKCLKRYNVYCMSYFSSWKDCQSRSEKCKRKTVQHALLMFVLLLKKKVFWSISYINTIINTIDQMKFI